MKKFLFKSLYKKTLNRILKSYLSVNYTPKVFEIDQEDRCLCLAPHADDESIGMGGTLSKYNLNFDVVCLTDGSRGIKHMPSEQVKQIRLREFEDAMLVAGIDTFKTLNIPDRALIDNYETFSTLDISVYDYIFLPNLIDQHKDHKAVSVLLHRLLKERKFKPELQIAFFEVWSPLSFVNKCINISDYVDNKRVMLEKHSSQLSQRSYYEAALALSQYRGLAKETGYAEAFLVMDVKEFMTLIEEVYPLGLDSD